MKYLTDTNIFFHQISDRILQVTKHCRDHGCPVCITPTIINELEPSYYQVELDSAADEIYNCVNNLTHGSLGITTIKLIKLSDVPGAESNLRRIRGRYYGWINEPTYLRRLIDKGVLEWKDIKKLKKKDMGECELLAIAEAANDHWIVTNDKGRVYLHPETNIFDEYRAKTDIKFVTGEEWETSLRVDELRK